MASQSEVQSTNLLDEDLVSPSAGFQDLTGQRSSPTTFWRYITKGLQGHKLESVKVLGRTLTSRQAIRRFLAKVEASRAEAQAATCDDGTDERSEDVQRKLEVAGLV